MFLVGRIKSVPFGLVGILITSTIKSGLTHAFALRILINLARHVGTVLLVLVAELGYDGSQIWSNSGLRLRSLGKNRRRWLLCLILSIHDRQEFLEVNALPSGWWLRYWELRHLWHLRWSLRLRLLLLAEHVDCSLEVRRGSL